jgi:hypothetical protein
MTLRLLRPALMAVRALPAVCALLAAAPAHAQMVDDLRKVGTTGMPLLEMPLSPRTNGLGDIRASDNVYSADALFNNPAGLARATERHMVTASHTQWLVGTSVQSVGYAYNAGNRGSVGVSVARLDLGTMQGTRNAVPGQVGGYVVTETFSAESLAFGLTYARRLTDRFSFGGTARYVTERIDSYSADAVVADFGMLYDTGFRSLRIGALLQNFGTDGRYLEDPFKMPIAFRLATAMEVLGHRGSANRLTVSVEALHPNNDDQRLHVGLEYGVVEALSLRGGYKLGYDEEALALGVGLQFPGLYGIGFDLAYVPFNRLGTTLGFGLRAGW